MILRDRISDLLNANIGLQREVSELKKAYDSKTFASETAGEETLSADLKETKKSLNEIATENDQLKLEIAKAR